MQENIIEISGMHCPACVSLVKMEVEDLGLQSKLESVELVDGEHKGIAKFRPNTTTEEIASVKKAINENLEQYTVIEQS